MIQSARGLRSSNGTRLVLAGSGSLTRRSRLGLSADAESMEGQRWEFRSSYALRRSYQAVEPGGTVVGEFSRPLTLGRNSPLTWYGEELYFHHASLLRKDWVLVDGEGARVLGVHAHTMFGKNKVSLHDDEGGADLPYRSGLELFCAWLATRFSIERIRLAGA